MSLDLELPWVEKMSLDLELPWVEKYRPKNFEEIVSRMYPHAWVQYLFSPPNRS